MYFTFIGFGSSVFRNAVEMAQTGKPRMSRAMLAIFLTFRV